MNKPTDKGHEKSDTKDNQEFSTAAFDIHRQMVVFLFAATFASVVIISFFLWRLYVTRNLPDTAAKGTQVTPLILVALAGVLGGFVSALRRLYAFAPVFPSITFSFWSKRSTAYVLMYSAIPPLVGAIAAVVVYLIFAGGLLQGPLFPEFGFDPGLGHPQDNSFENFVANWKPLKAVDFAKAFVWAFVAGFSEKFVPDILNRLAKSSQKAASDADETSPK